MKNINYYVKETPDIWEFNKDIFFNKILDENKVYAEGYFKKNFLKGILWLLRKLNLKCDIISSHKENFTVQKHRIDNVDLIKLIQKSKIDMEYVWRENPKYLIVGYDQYEKLVGSAPTALTFLDNELTYHVNRPTYNEFDDYNNKLMKMNAEVMIWDFKIIVVPWINGCFLLPSL